MSCYFVLCFYCILDVRSSECDVGSLYVCVAMLMDLYVNCLVIQFAICLGVFAILLLNVMDPFSVAGGALLDILFMVSKECVCCACDPSERLDAPSICFVCVFFIVCQKLSPHLGV